ncbi:MAG: hypothetical protein AABZ30_10025 [Myxococcota bacterium]|mgnify:CR=1 FL=1
MLEALRQLAKLHAGPDAWRPAYDDCTLLTFRACVNEALATPTPTAAQGQKWYMGVRRVSPAGLKEAEDIAKLRRLRRPGMPTRLVELANVMLERYAARTREHAIRREDAVRLVRQQAVGPPLRRLPAQVYVSRRPLEPGELVLRVAGALIGDDGPHPDGSWVGMIDLMPEGNWAHPCRYVFVDPNGAVRQVDASWYPIDREELFAREV